MILEKGPHSTVTPSHFLLPPTLISSKSRSKRSNGFDQSGALFYDVVNLFIYLFIFCVLCGGLAELYLNIAGWTLKWSPISRFAFIISSVVGRVIVANELLYISPMDEIVATTTRVRSARFNIFPF
jgi:hypothetical protein